MEQNLPNLTTKEDKKIPLNKRRFECEYCHEKLLIRSYKRHLKQPCKDFYKLIEINSNDYLCKICFLSSRIRDNLYKHIIGRHKNDQKVHEILNQMNTLFRIHIPLYFFPWGNIEKWSAGNNDVFIEAPLHP